MNDDATSRWAPASAAPTIVRGSRPHVRAAAASSPSSSPMRLGHEHRLQPVGHAARSTNRSNGSTPCRGDVRRGTNPPATELLDHHHHRRVGVAPQHLRHVVRIAARPAAGPASAGSDSTSIRRSSGSENNGPHPGRASSEEPVEEADVERPRVEHDLGDDVAAAASGVVRRRQLQRHLVPPPGVDQQRVPVERAVGGGRHVGHEVQDRTRERPGARVHRQRRAGVRPQHRRQLHQLGRRRRPRRHRVAVAVAVAGAERRRQPEAALGQGGLQQRLHPGPTSSSDATPSTAASPIANRRNAEWPHEEPGVDRDGCRPIASSHSPKRVQSHDNAGLERLERACPRPGPSSAAGSRRAPVPSGARVKPQLPPIDGGDAVERRRRGRRVPRQLGVVVGVQVDEAGRDDEPRTRRGSTPRAAPRRLQRRTRPSAIADVGPAPRRPGAVDDRTADDADVERHAVHARARHRWWTSSST